MKFAATSSPRGKDRVLTGYEYTLGKKKKEEKKPTLQSYLLHYYWFTLLSYFNEVKKK